MEVSAGGGGALKHVSNQPVCTSVSLPEKWGHRGGSLSRAHSAQVRARTPLRCYLGASCRLHLSVTLSVYDMLRGPLNSSKPARRTWILNPDHVDASLSQSTLTQMQRDWSPSLDIQSPCPKASSLPCWGQQATARSPSVSWGCWSNLIPQ